MRPKTPLGGKSGSALEKLARGLKTIGRSRTDVTEMLDDPKAMPSVGNKLRTLRKMRSMGAIERNGNKPMAAAAPVSANDMPMFDVDMMRKHRMKYEAGVVSSFNL